jgi:hypothetical protein
MGPTFGASRSLILAHGGEFAARTAARPFQMKFNRENALPGLAQPSADLQARQSGLVQAVQPTGHRSRLREAVADPADDEGLRALGPSDSPPESPSQATDLCFRNSIIAGRSGGDIGAQPRQGCVNLHLVKPNVLYRPGLSIRKDYGLADKLRPGFLERAKDR